MVVVFRWLMRLFLVFAGLMAVGIGLIYYLASRSLPDYDMARAVTGIRAPLEIVRDTHNVPHVFGASDPDVYFGLGFAHAQDRLWQMTVLRRTAQGRLSEIFGVKTLPVDDLLRRLDIYNLADVSLEFQSDSAKSALQAYSDGVNAWLKVVRQEALGRGAPEFFFFSNKIAPWRPVDSLAILRLMALRQSSQITSEVLRARTSLLIAPARLADILPDAPGPGAAALPEYGRLFPNMPRFAGNTEPVSRFLDPVPLPQLAGASNAFAAAPARAAREGSLLANDPHMSLSAPSLWMLARLNLTSGAVIGATIPGMPAVFSGRSQRLGWGITAAYLDDQDLFVEELNPQNPNEYRGLSGFKPFQTRRDVIQIKDAAPVPIRLRWSDNGPVLPAGRYNLGAITPKGHVATLSWTGLDPKDTSMSALLQLMQAQDVPAAIDATRGYFAPAQNLMLVDQTRIGFQVIGKMPARRVDHESQGRLPTAGWRAQNQWLGYLPYENNPRIIDPSGGLIANTNNKTVDRPFPDHVSFDWGDSQRIERLQKLLRNRRVHTRESFIEAQLDEVSFSARSLLPLIARDLWFEDGVAATGTQERRRKTALGLLADWNGQMNEHLPEPLIFAAWLRALQQRLTQDELGPLVREFTHADPVFIERVFRDINGAAVWCDVVQSEKAETCADIARAALDQSLQDLTEKYGTRILSWRWGDAHQAVQDHEVLGQRRFFGWLVNIRQSTSGGDNTLMRGKTRGTGDAPFANVHAAGYRGVYDLGDPEASVFIISTGQSGHPLSRHYDDLAQLWRRGGYIPMTLDPDLARAAAVGITRLRPAVVVSE